MSILQKNSIFAVKTIFFADEQIHQEFKDVYTGLYSSKERYIDVVKAIGSRFYGMTQSEISKAVEVKSMEFAS